MTTASVVVVNHDYAQYLPDALDSALAQTHPAVEVVVVDDGSTDDSRAVIASYGDLVTPVLKPNAGQSSAFNAGFAASCGDVVLFLDADDALLPHAVEGAAAALDGDPDAAKVHWPLTVVDRDGRATGAVRPTDALDRGDLRAELLAQGPECYASPPTSGNAWRRRCLERMLPLPEIEARVGSQAADVQLMALAPLYGSVLAIDEPLSRYRIHGANNLAGTAFERKLARDIACHEACCELLADRCAAEGVDPTPDAWRERSWLRRFARAREELAAALPADVSLVLIDEAGIGPEVAPGRTVIPFLERDGEYWGAPPDDDTAIRELERLRAGGAGFTVVGWTAFWWLDHYKRFAAHLHARFRCVIENDRLVAFDLRSG
jgi:glycosyltransferase involved in cell wall biosynthesis